MLFSSETSMPNVGMKELTPRCGVWTFLGLTPDPHVEYFSPPISTPFFTPGMVWMDSYFLLLLFSFLPPPQLHSLIFWFLSHKAPARWTLRAQCCHRNYYISYLWRRICCRRILLLVRYLYLFKGRLDGDSFNWFL